MTHEPPTVRTPGRATASRRGFLVGVGLAVLGAAGGLGAGLLKHHSSPDAVVPPDPDVLLAAVTAERRLVAQLDAALKGARDSDMTALLRLVRADHRAHLAALTGSVATATGNPTPSLSPVAPATTALTAKQLRAAETAAAAAAAARAAKLTGRAAALLASISACEASHAELLA